MAASSGRPCVRPIRGTGCAVIVDATQRLSPGEPLTFLPNREPTSVVYVVRRQRARSAGAVPTSITCEPRQTPARTAGSDASCT